MDPVDFLRALFAAALAAVDPQKILPSHLPPAPKGRTLVLAMGKGAAAMAAATEAHSKGPITGLAITRYRHALPLKQIECVEAGHPMPDDAGALAARRMLQLAGELGPDDQLLCLISGGGSALTTLPPDTVPAADLRAINKALLACGAPIAEINAVRKHLSVFSGGRLARAAAAKGAVIHTFMISDVPGDDPAVIASGPTVPDETTCADAIAILRHYQIPLTPAVKAHLEDPAAESVKPKDPLFRNARHSIIATARDALAAAAEAARKAGVTPVLLGDRIEGEAREVGLALAGMAHHAYLYGEPFPKPCVFLSGGETTVTVKGQGRGGRNSEFLLAATAKLGGLAGVYGLAADTDGIDGTEDNAGAYFTPETLARAAAKGFTPKKAQAENDAYGFFEAAGSLIVTGPTLTNVNDFRAILIL